MFEQLIRDFCGENNYEILENYETHTMFGEPVTTVAIVVKPNHNIFEVQAQLASYLEMEAKEFDDQLWGQLMDALEGCNVGEHGPDALIYFPYMALSPKE